MAQINTMKLIREGREALEDWAQLIEEHPGRSRSGILAHQFNRARGTALGTAESIVMYYALPNGLETLDQLRAALDPTSESVSEARAAWERLVELAARRATSR